jgi:hypothetical protein
MTGRISDIADRLNGRCEDVATALLGPTEKRQSNARELRWYPNGKLRLGRTGRKRGKWQDFETEEHGDTLDLIQYVRGGSRDDAIAWARDYFGGLITDTPALQRVSYRPEAIRPAAPEPDPDDAKRTADALDSFNRACPLSEPAAEIARRYYTVRLYGRQPPPEIIGHGDLRFDPRGAWRVYDESEEGRIIRLPTILARMRDIRTNEPKALHRTALRADGGDKATMPDKSKPKKMLGPRAGCAIKLSPDDAIEQGLGLSEGIETGLAIMIAFGWSPVWAAGDAPAIRTFPNLPGLCSLTVFPDHDTVKYRPDGTPFWPGQDAAEALADRLLAEGFPSVRTILPPTPGKDWNDEAGRLAA